MEYLLVVCAASMGVGAVVGAAAVGYIIGRTNWINGVRRFKDRKHGRGVWQLTYRSRFTPTIEDRSSRAVREPLTTSL